MIFGRTKEEREAREAVLKQWHPTFVWWPAKLIDGRRIWLERAERRLHNYASPCSRGQYNIGFFVDAYDLRLPS